MVFSHNSDLSKIDVYALETSDCNSALIPGRYICTDASNSPDEYGILLVSSISTGKWIFQEFITASEAAASKKYIRAKINDIGWTAWEQLITNADFVDLTLNSGFTNANNNYGGRNALGYCKIGDIVYVAGGVGITNYSGTNTVATVLPSGYRPATNHYYFCATGGSRIARVYISPDGNIFVEWVKNIDDGSTMTGEVTWIDLSTWFVAV